MMNFGPHTLRHVIPHMPCHIKLYPPILTVRFLKILMNGWHSNLFKNSELIHWFTSLRTKIAQPRHNYPTVYSTGPSEHHCMQKTASRELFSRGEKLMGRDDTQHCLVRVVTIIGRQQLQKIDNGQNLFQIELNSYEKYTHVKIETFLLEYILYCIT